MSDGLKQLPPMPQSNEAGSFAEADVEKKLRDVRRTRSFGTFRAVMALVLREMSTTYGRSWGGYIWAILEPAGGIFLLTLVFSLGFREPPIGTSFAIFYATGFWPFTFFLDLSGKVSGSLTFSKALLNYPAVTFLDAIVGRIITNVVTQLLVGFVIFAAILSFQDTRTILDIEGIALGCVMVTTLGAGVGTMNGFLFLAFPTWQRIWSILMRPLFLASCIFFMFDNVPEEFQKYLWFNPLIHCVGQMRASFYPYYVGEYISVSYVMFLGLVLFVIGLALQLRYHRDLLSSS